MSNSEKRKIGEERLVASQRRSSNLTTYEVYPFPPSLAEIAYPLDAKGCLIPPGLLQMHSRTHKFPMPKCFHGTEATLVLTRNHHGKKKDFVDFICGEHGKGNDCKFRVNVDRLVASSVSLTCTRYSLRESAQSSDSSGSMISWSPPPFGSIQHERRMDDVTMLSSISGDSNMASYDGSQSSGDCYSDVSDYLDCPGSPLERDENAVVETNHKTTGTTIHGVISPKANDQPSGRNSDSSGSFYESDIPEDHLGLVDGGQLDMVEEHYIYRPPNRFINSCGFQAEAGDHEMYEGDAYPLRARRDGMPSIISCIDHATYEFSDELFLAQIVKESEYWCRQVAA